jgi:hypothetical protein
MQNRAFLRCVLLAIAASVAAIPTSWPSNGATTGSALAAADACASGQAGKDTFAALAISALQRAGFAYPITYDSQGFRLLLGSAGEGTVRAFLGNAHGDYCKASDDETREAVLQHFAGIWAGLSTIKPGAIPASLLPAVRGRAYFERTRLQAALDGKDDTEEQYVMTLGSDIAVTVARDSGEVVGLLTESSYSRLGIKKDEAMKIAIRNLSERSEVSWSEVGPSLFQSGWHDYYDPARLLLPDLIKRLPIRGNPVAIAVDTDTLFVTGSENTQALLDMGERARKALERATRPLSGQAITLVDGNWIDFSPQEPALRPFIDLQKESRYADYSQQAKLLQRLYEKRGDQVFVAPYDLFRKESAAELTSFSTWAGGIVTLLPRTDVVGFVENEQAQPFIVPWDAVREIAGHLMMETKDYPTRYRVDAFPSAMELARLRKAAI